MRCTSSISIRPEFDDEAFVLPGIRLVVDLGDNQVLVGYGTGWFIAKFD